MSEKINDRMKDAEGVPGPGRLENLDPLNEGYRMAKNIIDRRKDVEGS